MTPTEKSERALNRRIEQLQEQMQRSDSEVARRYLIQALLVCIGLGEAISDYVATIRQYAKARHGALKVTQIALTAQHEELLNSGKQLLERLKAAPTDRALRKEIETTQRGMAAIQKSLRRGADTLQREVGPSMRLIDQVADSVRRLCEAEGKDTLKRPIKAMVGHVQELYRTHPALPAKGIIDGAAWEKSALAAIDEATDFNDAQARAGFQAILALEVMIMAISPTPPQSAEETTERANASVALRLQNSMTRLTKAPES